MGDAEKNDASADQKQSQKPNRDFWDKLDIFSKFATAIVIALVSIMVNLYLSEKEKNDNNITLYARLLSDKETAENTLRKDMFSKILESFLGEKKKNKGGIEKIREMRLNLELLTRNFHESLDMKPLFKHLQMEIIHSIAELRKEKIALCRELRGNELCKELKDEKAGDMGLKKAAGLASAAIGNASRHQAVEAQGQMTQANQSHQKQAGSKLKDVHRNLADYEGELKSLVDIAKRVSRKQREVLEEVAGKITFEIPLADQSGDVICTEYKPNEPLPIKLGECKDNGISFRGYSTEKRLVFKDPSGKKIIDSTRHFKMRVRYAYPKWRRVFVEVESWECEEKHRDEKFDKCRTEAKRPADSFWLEYFDFPLVDNTYINNEQRYSVVLEDFKEGANSEIDKAVITLLYYPASYAGLKEKSFYNNQLMNNLLKSKMFHKE